MTITKWPAIGNCHRRIRPAPAVPPQDSCVRLAWQSNVRGRTDPRRGKAGTPMTTLRVPGARCNNDWTAWMKWASSRTDSLRRRFPAAVTEKHFGPTSKSTTRTGRSVHPGCPPVHRTRWCPSSAKSAGASIGEGTDRPWTVSSAFPRPPTLLTDHGGGDRSEHRRIDGPERPLLTIGCSGEPIRNRGQGPGDRRGPERSCPEG